MAMMHRPARAVSQRVARSKDSALTRIHLGFPQTAWSQSRLITQEPVLFNTKVIRNSSRPRKNRTR